MASEGVERRLVAILAADVAGFSRLIGIDEEGTLARLKAHRRELIDPKISQHGGRVVKTAGDGILIEFPSVVAALRCAVEVQRAMAERIAGEPPERRIVFRVGVHVGDVVVEDGDLLGDGVNVAARLEGIAEPGSICVSQRVHEDAAGKIDVAFEDLGDQQLKNIARPVRVYRAKLAATPGTAAPALSLPDKPSIAVLPFQNMSGDPEQEYFADGMVEEIITALSRFRQLFVIARNSSFAYKGKSPDVRQVGRELGVRYVLEGSVRKATNRVRITGQLIDATTGAHLWADRFDGGLEDIFDLQDQVTASVVGAIAPRLETAEIERAKRKPTTNLDAYDHFLRGMASYYQFYQFANREGSEEALRQFTGAIDLDPEFASALGVAAHSYAMRKANGWMAHPDTEMAEAVGMAQRAAALGRDDALALCMAGATLAYVARDLAVGVALTDRALALNPNMGFAWLWSGYARLWQGDPDGAVDRLGRAMRLSPMDLSMPAMQAAMADALFHAGRYDEASSWAGMALRNPRHNALRIAAASNALAGRLEVAREAMARLRQLDPALRISNLRNVQGPYRRPEDHARYEEAMRLAGLPE